MCKRSRKITLRPEEAITSATATDLATGGEKADSKPLQKEARKKALRKAEKNAQRKSEESREKKSRKHAPPSPRLWWNPYKVFLRKL